MKKYYASGEEIKCVDAVRETEKQVVIDWYGRERREAKISEYCGYFDSWDEAHEWLLDRANKRIERVSLNLDYEQSKYDKIAALKK